MSVKNHKLENEVCEVEKNQEHLNSFLPSSPPLAASCPSCSLKSLESTCSSDISSSSNFIEETLKSPLGPTLKKRKVVSECRKVSTDVDGVGKVSRNPCLYIRQEFSL